MVGTTISHYKVLEKIGQGGMGEVYLAQDTKLDRKVALKFLPEELQQDPTARKRFLREAKSAAALDHPYICHIHEVGEVEGKSFISMEYLQGETLKDKLAEGPLAMKEALQKATEIAEALEAAHKQEIVHRDLKPSNIMLTPESHVKVMDFGLAKRVTPVEGQEQEITTALTEQGATLGTVPYMSPEQVRGQVVDTRSDIFSFGVVLYEMLSGVNPFKKGSAMDTAHAILGETAPPLTRYTDDIPVLLQHTVRKMLAKEPDDRYQLVHEVRTDLAVLIHEIEEVLAKPTTAPPTSQAPRRLQPWAMAVGLVVLTAIVTSLAVWSLIRSSPPLPLPETPVRKFELLVPSLGLSPPQISPDGTKIVYFSEGQLWIRELDQWQPRALDDTQNGEFPCWSPDSTLVAYFAADGRLMKVPISGGEPQVVAAVSGPLGGSANCTWEPNGRILIAGINEFGLLAVSSQGGDLEEILPRNKGERDFHEVSQLPGGAVLFSTHEGSIEYFDGSTRKEILRLENEYFARPIYSESGYLVYYRGTMNPGIWAVPFSLSRQEIRGQPVLVVPGGNFPSLSKEGPRTLAYVAGPGGLDQQLTFVWVDREGREEPVAAEPRAYREFSLSPDGTKIAVRVTGAGTVGPGTQDVWIYHLVRDTQMRLTFDPTAELFPIWTPDGQRVAFGSPDGLSWKAADGTGEVETLVESSGQHFPQAFSPDGTALIFEDRSSSGADLGMLSLGGEHISTLLLETEFTAQNATLSPDGRWMAYESNESGQFEVYVRPFPDVNGGRWQVSSSGGGWPLWSADGQELFYAGSQDMMAVPIETEPTFTQGTADLLFDLGPYLRPSATRYQRRIAISPEGDRFLMQSNETSAARSIHVVLNWFEELKRLVPIDN